MTYARAVGFSEAGRRIYEAGLRYQRANPEEAPKTRARPVVVPLAAFAPAPKPPPVKRPERKPEAATDVWSIRKIPPRFRTIIEEVAAKHNIEAPLLIADTRKKAVALARHEAVYRCVAETTASLPQLARYFRRDHTTIGFAVMAHHYRTGAPLPRGMKWKGTASKKKVWRRAAKARLAMLTGSEEPGA